MGIVSYLGGAAFVIITVVMGGAAAWMSGRAIAGAWRPIILAVPAVVALTLTVRFLHYALAHEPLLAPGLFGVDLVVLMVFGLVGWQRTRARQMVRQYPWLYEPAGPLGWRQTSSRPG